MSTSRGPVRLVQQMALDGSVSLVELHGVGARTRANVLRCGDRRVAAEAVRAARVLSGATLVAEVSGDCDRPCPRCGTSGDPEIAFGFRLMNGRRRRRQSWCRSCRGKATA